jgi:hypothetical protein
VSADAPDPGRLRATDAERDAVVEQLRAALTDGRLDVDEHDERVQRALESRTRGELVPLTEDLAPAERPGVPHPTPSRHGGHGHGHGGHGHASSWRAWASTAVLLWTIWLITCLTSGELQHPWPIWPTGIWGAVLVGRRLTGGDDGPRGLAGPPPPPQPPTLGPPR